MGVCLLLTTVTIAQKKVNATPRPPQKCSTMEYLDRAIAADPSLPAKWKAEGEKQYKAYLQQKKKGNGNLRPLANDIIIPIVFHIVDEAAIQDGITDRDIYEQVEILNRDYRGLKAENFKGLIPDEIFNRTGHIPVKFILARRTPTGLLTSGIERRSIGTPGRVEIKSTATGGLDAWDETKYLNVWAGTFSGADLGLLGIATFPFTDTEGPQGCVIGTATFPYVSNTSRPYYPAYSEGGTLSHEVGHYLYLWHTFGDQSSCNNADFRIQAGWPLPLGAGPGGDDTPAEKGTAADAFIFGNPSQNYSDGCSGTSYGMMYGSFMNYFDDRALFMFSDGQRKRAEGCIDLYRPGLLTSNGATPPVSVTDAYLVSIAPMGLPERIKHIINNTPLSITIRNSGTSNLTSVTANVKLDAGAAVPTVFPLALAPGNETTLQLAPIVAVAGQHIITIYTSAPNGSTDNFLSNDTLQSFLYVTAGTATTPFSEDFSTATFPPAGWQLWNPNGGTTNTWTRSSASGNIGAGSAFFNNFSISQTGTLDDLVTPAISYGVNDSSLLTFDVAYGVYDVADVSVWDGLEIYISNDGGANYKMVYKKTGNALKSIAAAQSGAFTATPAQPDRWRNETVNLSPYILPGQKMLVRFRNTNAFGNNLFIDNINVSGVVIATLDVQPLSIDNLADFNCTGTITPSVTFRDNGKANITSVKVNYRVDNGALASVDWTGNISRGQTAQAALNALAGIPVGNHVLTVYTSSPNGSPDEVPSNDTIRKAFSVIPTVPAPVIENFESTSFPPANWTLFNPDNSKTWERTTLGVQAQDGVASMYINNKNYTSLNTVDKLISPIITLNAVDSAFVSFDYAYVQGVQYPGSTVKPLDTLEVALTDDCGNSFTTLWKKWGEDLQTIGDPNYATAIDFVPSLRQEWKHIVITVPGITTATKSIQVFFNANGNGQNNLYVDNINISGKKLPQRLKDQGYLVYPSPFTGSFRIHHLVPPVDLQSAQVYNAGGQLVWDKRFSGSTPTEVFVDLKNLANGVYVLKMIYTNKTVVERIVKK